VNFAKTNRVFHRWGAICVALPLLLVISSGLMLQLKKQLSWIQPPTREGVSRELGLTFDQILQVARSVPEAQIDGWDDIDRLDVRPAEGMLKVRGVNRWEIQIDGATGDVLQVAYRRSDLIESLHDGSFFHDEVKLWIFFPSGLILLSLWISGLYMFLRPYLIRRG
jgi:uncharacterized iron-regulated membrane protein